MVFLVIFLLIFSLSGYAQQDSTAIELEEVIVQPRLTTIETVHLGLINIPTPQLTSIPSLFGEKDIQMRNPLGNLRL